MVNSLFHSKQQTNCSHNINVDTKSQSWCVFLIRENISQKNNENIFFAFFSTFPKMLKLICPESVDITEKELNPFK